MPKVEELKKKKGNKGELDFRGRCEMGILQRETETESKRAGAGEGKKMALREKERHKINLRKGIVEETLVE